MRWDEWSGVGWRAALFNCAHVVAVLDKLVCLLDDEIYMAMHEVIAAACCGGCQYTAAHAMCGCFQCASSVTTAPECVTAESTGPH